MGGNGGKIGGNGENEGKWRTAGKCEKLPKIQSGKCKLVGNGQENRRKGDNLGEIPNFSNTDFSNSFKVSPPFP